MRRDNGLANKRKLGVRLDVLDLHVRAMGQLSDTYFSGLYSTQMDPLINLVNEAIDKIRTLEDQVLDTLNYGDE